VCIIGLERTLEERKVQGAHGGSVPCGEPMERTVAEGESAEFFVRLISGLFEQFADASGFARVRLASVMGDRSQ
jgi:hypothetical protein